MEDNKNTERGLVYSKRLPAGKRTYFFDVRETRNGDYYIVITESKKKFDEFTYIKQKLHIYKEDFNKFSENLKETMNYVKQELLPEYDFEEFDREYFARKQQNEEEENNDTNDSFSY